MLPLERKAVPFPDYFATEREQLPRHKHTTQQTSRTTNIRSRTTSYTQ